MKKVAIKALAVAVFAASLTGCMGQMGTSAMVTKANLSVVDNRYGRAGLFMLLSPVYGIAATADFFIFNTIEFWTGTNPITGKSPAVVDMPVDAIFKVNHKLDKSMTEVPLDSITSASFKQVDENTVEMQVTYTDGKQAIMRGEKSGEEVIPIEFSNYCITAQSREHRLNSRPASLQRLFQASQQQSTIFS
ncbi:DUF3332 domain-containing protein [Endozoicomonas atrinae]|uniref:DUF3332 domain-containing protein n=1 Tax=Endozoicomonas atrinae TaxID=1333660 RepID=UPI0008257CC3|nr:DUF3332 domain-containing protein [Endozoicomonas atrinae]